MFVFKVFFQLCFLSSHHRMDASTTQNFALILRSPWWPLAIKPIFPQPLTLYNSVTRKLLSYSPSHWSWEQWGRLVMSANLEIVQNSNRPWRAEIKFAPGPFSLTLKKSVFPQFHAATTRAPTNPVPTCHDEHVRAGRNSNLMIIFSLMSSFYYL